jgi:hypothetical protein
LDLPDFFAASPSLDVSKNVKSMTSFAVRSITSLDTTSSEVGGSETLEIAEDELIVVNSVDNISASSPS